MTRVSHLLTQTVTWDSFSSFDASGDPVYGSQQSAAARVEFGTFRIIMADGEERDAVARVTTEADVPDKARLWLPGDDTGTANDARVIMRKNRASTPNGAIELIELFL